MLASRIWGIHGEIGCALSDGTVHVASVEMTNRVYSKILVLEPIRGEPVRVSSAIHPKRTGRRRARATYRAYVPCKATRYTSAQWQRFRFGVSCDCFDSPAVRALGA
jgi:hypothetical protein